MLQLTHHIFWPAFSGNTFNIILGPHLALLLILNFIQASLQKATWK